ncbi:MAG: DNA (cytosine-5-)-methyltransferase [Alphaproteobacteria bacterium]|nr:DNA (cytosine-5-)-methyltransferase [Alphaproteobacteria bacterium]
MARARPTFLEFFAGGGMARQGLGGSFDCVFSNDFDPMKCAAYRRNFVGEPISEGDVWNLDASAIPAASLAWASFPCQDLSLAGARRGLNAPRSGAFWGFWNIIEALDTYDRAPKTLALENVPGLLSSHGGRDFTSLVTHLAEAGYRVGAMTIDAALFSPQSRPRLFIVAHKGKIPDALVAETLDPAFHPTNLRDAVAGLPHETRMAWVWWRLPHPPKRNVDLAAVLERDPPAKAWRSDQALEALLAQMAPLHRARLDAAVNDGAWRAGAVFRRIRIENGKKVQRAEVRYDGVAGCLRTPAGGSSKQLLLVSENGRVRLRPLLAVEAARLMGCDEGYQLPENETAALKVLGDGVSVPVVRWLGRNLLAPLANRAAVDAAA